MSGPARLRVWVFAVLALLMCGFPAYGVFVAGDEGVGKHVGWRMYRYKALDLCAVEYREHSDDGSERVVDRFELLVPEGHDPPWELWRIEDAERAYGFGRRICNRLGRGTDLRLHLRCAEMDGWHVVDEGEQNVCLAGVLR